MFLLLLTVVNAKYCPKYECASMTTDLCCEFVSENLVHFNINGCPNDMTCLVQSIVNLMNSATGSGVNCTSKQPPVNDSEFKTSCLDFHSNRDLEVGEHPKQCDSNSDCKMKDGDVNQCICSLNSKAYCQPDFSSKTFNFYWKECADNNDFIRDPELYRYAELLIAFYPYTIDPVSCTDDYFSELSEMSDLAVKLGDKINPNSTELQSFQYQPEADEEDSSYILGISLSLILGNL